MNRQEMDILLNINNEPFVNQRILSEVSGYSLGTVNKSLKSLMNQNMLNSEAKLTAVARKKIKASKPENAIILAAGFGMRMLPASMDIPKALMEAQGEILIERLIRQLNEAGIKKIYVIVGFLKEKFDYLIDEYGVELIVNMDYSVKNNLHSLALVAEHIHNSYVIPSDIWFEKNPFSKDELYSWYMVSDIVDDESEVRINRKMELVRIEEISGNSMVGVAYLAGEEAKTVRERLSEFDKLKRYNHSYWEDTLYEKDRMIVQARLCKGTDYMEINTYEQLREFDEDSNHLKSDAIRVIEKVLDVNKSNIKNVEILKKGTTNRSFLFECKGKRYVMRIAGINSEIFVNRESEEKIYKMVNEKGICENLVYINHKNGYKITEFLEDYHSCNSNDWDEVTKCMKKLRNFHNLKLETDYEYDIFEDIKKYEKMWKSDVSIYKDHDETQENVFKLKSFLDENTKEKCVTHVDSHGDNYMVNNDDVRIIDWEYAGMADPVMDVAMFGIYANYDRADMDKLIDIYFENKCSRIDRLKIYCYIAISGMVWSNWCEYKMGLGIEFGDYPLTQYRYAKDYYKIVMEELVRNE